jgi:deoxyribonuclease V
MPDASIRIACLDAAYSATMAYAACVLFDGWPAASAVRVVTASTALSGLYEPGAFFKRELPVLTAALALVEEPLAGIVIDGYVWLDGSGRPGLGARLQESVVGGTPVIGVAKTLFRSDDWSVPVLRGKSQRPLYVTAAGIPAEDAARAVRSMHGEHRIPTMLGFADRIARALAADAA